MISLCVQYFLLPSELVGPDYQKYFELAERATSLDFWKDPDAFNGNYWPIGYPLFVALIWKIVGGIDYGLLQLVQIALAAGFVFTTLPFTNGYRTGLRLAVGILVGISPSVISMGQTGGYEILLGMLLIVPLGILWTYFRENRIDRKTQYFMLVGLAGLLIGLAFLVVFSGCLFGFSFKSWMQYFSAPT